jgi:hypothetical protein
MLGAKPISEFNEANDRTTLAANLFPMVRDDILRSHPWNCAIKRKNLAPMTEAPEFDYSAKFLLPPDWLRTLSVGEYGQEIDYRHEGRTILADASVLPLRYVFRNEDVATWDVMLIDMVTVAMAERMAYPITQSSSLADSMRQRLEMMAKRARAVDGQDDPPEMLGDERLLSARMGGR